jgi:hypothetical protein
VTGELDLGARTVGNGIALGLLAGLGGGVAGSSRSSSSESLNEPLRERTRWMGAEMPMRARSWPPGATVPSSGAELGEAHALPWVVVASGPAWLREPVRGA